MIFLETGSTDPYYNLAFEESMLTRLDSEQDVFMLWQNDNAVVVGRYQNTAAEVNLPFAEAHGTRVVRRMSGGGAVYHDLGNLNFSFITDAERYEDFDFSFFVQPLIAALKRLGISAAFNGRNDVTIYGRKISGNSQYLSGGRLLHHGTIMLSSNLDFVQQVLTVSAEKLESKGMKSVRSRVTCVNDHLSAPVSAEDFKALLLEELSFPEQSTLSEEALSEIRALCDQKYRTWDWNFGRNPICSMEKTRRFDRVGTITVSMEAEKAVLTDLHFGGDFFAEADPDILAQKLIGCPLDAHALQERLRAETIGLYLAHLSAEDLISMLI